MNTLKQIARQIKSIAEEVRSHLGCGFNETIYQNALAIEFRKAGIEYLKEVNIEIFYKGESVGVDRPDFIITRIKNYKKPFLLEIKVTDKITDNYRMQLKSYCTSLPRNTNPVLNDFAGGMLLAFPASDTRDDAKAKISVVDVHFNVLIDEQKEEEERKRLEKEKLRILKEEEMSRRLKKERQKVSKKERE